MRPSVPEAQARVCHPAQGMRCLLRTQLRQQGFLMACLCDVCCAARQQAKGMRPGGRRVCAKLHIHDHVCRQKSARGRVQHRYLPRKRAPFRLTYMGMKSGFFYPCAVTPASQQAARTSYALCNICCNTPVPLRFLMLPVPTDPAAHTGAAPRGRMGWQRGQTTWPGAWPGTCTKLKTPLGGRQAGCRPVTLARASATSPDAPCSSLALC